MHPGLEHYLILSAVLFCFGVYGMLTRRNLVAMLLCVELVLVITSYSIHYTKLYDAMHYLLRRKNRLLRAMASRSN